MFSILKSNNKKGFSLEERRSSREMMKEENPENRGN
jgi:hypothetical protein